MPELRWAGPLALSLVLLPLVGCGGTNVFKKSTNNTALIAEFLTGKISELEELEILLAKVEAEHQRTQGLVTKLDALPKPKLVEVRELSATIEAAMEHEGVSASPTPGGTGDDEPPPVHDNVSNLVSDALALHERTFQPIGTLPVHSDLLSSDLYSKWTNKLRLEDTDHGPLWPFEEGYADYEDEYEYEYAANDSARCRFGERLDSCLKLLQSIEQGAFDKQRTQLRYRLADRLARLRITKQFVERELEIVKHDREELLDSVDSAFDRLVMLGAPTLAVCTLFIYVVGGFRSRSDQRNITLPTITVLLLVSAIIILGLAGKLDNEVLGTLIGGISGYVLGKRLWPEGSSDTSTSPEVHRELAPGAAPQAEDSAQNATSEQEIES